MKMNFWKKQSEDQTQIDEQYIDELENLPIEQIQEEVYSEEYVPAEYSPEVDNHNIFGLMQNAGNLYAQCCEIKEKTKQVQAWSQAKITETVAKYKSCQEFLSYTFGERDKALSKQYEVLDKAVNNGDKDLIIAALQGISGIVTSSPLSDFDKFAKLYEDKSQPLLDF